MDRSFREVETTMEEPAFACGLPPPRDGDVTPHAPSPRPTTAPKCPSHHPFAHNGGHPRFPTISRSLFARLAFMLVGFSPLPAASAAIIQVNPGSGTLQAAISDAVTGNVPELVDGTHSGVSTITNKNLTLRTRAGTTPVLANNLTLQTGAKRLVAQGLSFGTGTRVTASDLASTLVLLQNTFNDAEVTCSGVRCIAIGNRFNPQRQISGNSNTHNVLGAIGTTALVFAGNAMLAAATFNNGCCAGNHATSNFVELQHISSGEFTFLDLLIATRVE